jgi:hypothetical protein
MTIVNRRNAILGWTVWTISKTAAKRKAKQALSTENKGPSKPTRLVIGSGLAVAAGGAIWLLRRKSGVDEI